MRGHEKLVEMRVAGSVPEWVFVDTEYDKTHQYADWHRVDNTTAVVLVEPSDRRLDFRFVVGMKCFVQGENMNRVHEIRDACISAGAKRVIAAVMRRLGRDEFVAFQTIEQTDTDGLFATPTLEHAHG